MKSDAEIQARAESYVAQTIADLAQLATENGSATLDLRHALAQAFVVGYAAGAEDQAGVISSRPLSPSVIRRRR